MAQDGLSCSRMPQHDPNMTPRRPEVVFWWPNMAPIAHDGPWGVRDRMAPDGLNIAPDRAKSAWDCTHDQREASDFVSSWFVATSAVVAFLTGKRPAAGELRCSMSASHSFFQRGAKLRREASLARKFNRCSATRTVPAKYIRTPRPRSEHKFVQR